MKVNRVFLGFCLATVLGLSARFAQAVDVRSADWRTKVNSVFQPMRPDFKDAATLQPVTLGRDERKQLFLTVHVPLGAAAGV